MIHYILGIFLFLSLTACATNGNRPELKRTSTNPQRERVTQPSPPPLEDKLVAVKNSPHVPGLVSTVPNTQLTEQVKTAEGFEAQGQWLEAAQSYQKALQLGPSPQDQELYKLKLSTIVDSRLDRDQLLNIAQDSEFQNLRAHALLRLAIDNYNNKNLEEAERLFKSAKEIAPEGELAFQADTYLNNLTVIKTVSPMKIGAILPLTGRSAGIGQRTLRGLEMGLGVNLPNSSFKLVVADSGGEVEGARTGAEKLIREENVIALVGDILSKTSPIVATVGEEYGVPVINLSQKSNITQIGQSVFRNSLTAEMQVQFLVRAAIQDLGMKRFAVMYPNSSYGVEYGNLFWNYVNAYGGKVVAAQTYSPSEKDFRLVVQRLLGIYYAEARKEEFNLRLYEARQSDKKKSIRDSGGEIMLSPLTDFDAVFIADGPQQLGIISSMFAFYDVPSMYFLGTNIWNSPGLAKRVSTYPESVIFTDSYQSSFNGTDRFKFVLDFKNQYNEEPSLFEIQAYDTGLLLKQFIIEGSQTRSSLKSKLTSFENFPGSIGYMSSGLNREIVRPLTAFTLKKGEVVPLKVKK